ncbi:MAG: hypothetical protein RSC29_01000, partial [Oscillospiraceae bacterium]
MKKFLCVILSVVCMMLNFNVFAEMPSGLKNIEGTAEGSESININILGANQYKIIESNNVKVEVKVNLKADKSMPYTVEYFCGNKKYGTEQFVVAPNTQVTKEFVIAGVNQGIQNFTINVISGGQIKKSLSQEYSIVIPAKKEFMDFYPTRGYNGSYNNEQMQYYMKLQGVNSQRTGEEWNNLEKAPGEYNYSPFDSWNGAVKNMGINTVYLLCYNNPIYNGVSPLVNIMSRQIGPKTKEEFDAFAKYAADFAAKHPDIKYFEVYNEPNIAFWSPGPNVTDYTYLVEVTNREVKKVRPDASIVSGVVAGAQAKFIMDMYDRNVYAHTDSISYHPYIYPAKVDDIYQVSIDGIHDTILGNGGFKEPTITEIGWATHEGGTGSSEETQSIELVKQFVVADASGVEMNEVHHMKDTGLNKAYNEENFGVIHYDGTLKPSFITVKNFFDESKGAKYFGKLSLGEEIQAHLYLKNSQITAVVWTKGNDTSHTFEGENIKTYDINGNYISDSNTVNIKEEPVYIKGLNLNNLNRELYFNLKEMLTHQLKAVSSKIEKNELDAIEGVFNTALEPIKELENNDELLDEDSALKLMHDYYTTIKDGVKEIKLNDAMLSSVYYMAYLGGKTIGNYYMMCVDGENYEPKS